MVVIFLYRVNWEQKLPSLLSLYKRGNKIGSILSCSPEHHIRYVAIRHNNHVVPLG